MEIQPELIPPCGLYCGVCRMYQATQAGERAFLERLVKVYARRFPELASAPPEALLCDGCLSERRSVFCRECSIRDCAQGKSFSGCHECPDFPCDFIDRFPMEVGKKVILRAVPYWRAQGTEAWVMAEEQRYRCLECGGRLYRGAGRCPHCKSLVDVD